METASFYDKFSGLYPVIDFFLKPQKQVLFREINALPDGKLLEIGIGNGAHLKLYQKHSITGIDTSSKMLQPAKKRNPGAMELLQMNGENLQFSENSFDYIVLSHVIAVAKNPEKMLRESRRVLKPGGFLFILNHFTPNNFLKHFDYFLMPISKLFHFRSVFKIEDLKVLRKEFLLLDEKSFAPLSYMKLLKFEKK